MQRKHEGKRPAEAALQTITWPKEFVNVLGTVQPTLTHNITSVININSQLIFYICNLRLASGSIPTGWKFFFLTADNSDKVRKVR